MPKPPETTEPPSPWLNFFREVRRLAAQLDEQEAKDLNNNLNGDGERLSQ